MTLKDLEKILDSIFEKNLALEGDRTGLQIGNLENDIMTVLITLDLTNKVLKEAIKEKAGLIISHHPLIFDPLYKIVNNSSIQASILKLIENNIAFYVAHTNLDAACDGLNQIIAEKIGLKNISILEQSGLQWYKFVVFVPQEAVSIIRDVISRNGGGSWGDYSSCTFNLEGTGTFKPLDGADPYIGEVGSLSFVDETRIECVVNENNLDSLVKEVICAHPYEEPAYDIYKIENNLTSAGLGRLGELENQVNFFDFLKKIKSELGLESLRWASQDPDQARSSAVKKVAVINGNANSFSERMASASLDCELVIVGELKYNKVLEIVQQGKILLELGHGESEKLAIDIMHKKLKEHFISSDEVKIIKSKTGYIPWRYGIE